MQKFRWGIIGCGRIAGKFATGLQAVPEAELAAVGSRTREKADAFAAEHGAKRAHGSYEALVADPEVDAVYVATPHPAHADAAILALRHHKAVLCEKPFTVNSVQLGRIIQVARDEGCFLMEAMWTRFFPAMARIRQLLAEGAIGEIRALGATFSFRSGWDPERRLLNPELGGGGLLDVGIYTLSFASMVMQQPPTGLTGFAHLGETGVDEQAAMVLKYPGGALAQLFCGVRTHSVHEAYVIGTDGRITVPPLFWQPRQLAVTRGSETEQLELPIEGNGYNYEAIEVMNCVRAGKLESQTMPLAESMQLMQTMDAFRAQWGLRYPCEG